MPTFMYSARPAAGGDLLFVRERREDEGHRDLHPTIRNDDQLWAPSRA